MDFLALGSIALPAGDGSKVGCVTIKGPAARISNYPAILRDVIERCQADVLESGLAERPYETGAI
jgi:hypothetical protein